MSRNCEKCLSGISKARRPGVKCGLCVSVFHIKCAGISEAALKELQIGSTTWLCPDCRSKSNRSILEETESGNEASSESEKNNFSQSDLAIILQGMRNQLDAVETSLSFLCKTFDDMKLTINKLSKDSECAQTKIASLEMKCNMYETKLNTIEAQLDWSSQQLNETNIVVCGIPPTCESIPKMIMSVVAQTGIKIENDNILLIKPMLHKKDTVSVLKSSVIVKLSSLELKNTILSAFRKKKYVCCSELGSDYAAYPPNQRIILLHHFTRFQSKLYKAAKSIKSNCDLQFLWCKGNRIFLRKSADSPVYEICSFNDINGIGKQLGFFDQSSSTSHSSQLDTSTAGNRNITA